MRIKVPSLPAGRREMRSVRLAPVEWNRVQAVAEKWGVPPSTALLELAVQAAGHVLDAADGNGLARFGR